MLSDDFDAERQVEFMELVTPNQSRLYGYIFALVQNSNDAHDIYQQTILVLWRKFHTFELGTNFCAWAFRTAKLECLSFHRRNRRERNYFDVELIDQISEEQTQRAEGVANERCEALKACVKKLSERDKNLLNECYRSGVKMSQVADMMGRSAQSLSNSLRRVRNMLHRCIENVVAQGNPNET